MGVGADIAAGNHGEKGNKADFVIRPNTSTKIATVAPLNEWKVVNSGDDKHNIEIANTSNASPTRFISIVKIPE
jgi:hypothetical protein